MFKILVIASTDYILQFKNEFEKSGMIYDYLIAQKNSVYDFGYLESQYLNIDQELVPLSENAELDELSESQRLKRIVSSSQMTQLKEILFQNLNFSKKKDSRKFVIQTFEKHPSKIIYFQDVVDLKMNQKDKKIHLEIQQSGVRSYDHILIEESYLNLWQFAEKFKQQDLFKIQIQQVYQLVGLKLKMSEDLGQFKFWSMIDSKYNSIYDNLYFLSMSKNIIDVWLWLPAQQLKNHATVKYYTERALKQLSQKFEFLNFEVLSEALSLQPINTSLEALCNYKNQITFIPHFHFYSDEQARRSLNHLSDVVIKKLKIKKEFMLTQPIEDLL